MTLTEQWKKGELEEGWYYIEIDAPFEQRIKDINHYSLGSFDIDIDSNYITEVLAPVPSYEEWERVKKYANKCEVEYIECANYYEKLKKENQQIRKWCEEFNALDVAKENQQLKELLKRCRDFINYEVPDHCIDDVLIDKIDNAIGEKK